MSFREFRKNATESVRVSPGTYEGIDRIDIRIFVRNRGGDIFRTRKGISLNIDQVPDLIEFLEWSLQQPCTDDSEAEDEPLMSHEKAEKLAALAHQVLSRHGLPVHWDIAERLVLENTEAKGFSSWQLHYVLATRRDLFVKEDQGCFRAAK